MNMQPPINALVSALIVAEQIRQGEAKSKVVGFGADTTMEDMLSQLDQFYKEDGRVTGDQMLAEASSGNRSPRRSCNNCFQVGQPS